jgi:hypothetical protein
MSWYFAIGSSLIIGIIANLWIRLFAPSRFDRLVGTSGVALFFLCSGFLGISGILSDFSSFPPPFAGFILGNFIILGLIAASKWGKRLALATPMRILVALQGFRVLPEILLDLSWRDGHAPIQMTYHGYNWDIITAATAITLGLAWPRLKNPVAWAWGHSILGIGLLINILTIAILSMPIPFRVFMNEPANTFVTRFPYIWLPGVHVAFAIILHAVLVRKLIQCRGKKTDAGA